MLRRLRRSYGLAEQRRLADTLHCNHMLISGWLLPSLPLAYVSDGSISSLTQTPSDILGLPWLLFTR